MIDSKAVIDSSAKIHEDVTIGPFSVIGADVEIESGTIIASHVVINGPTFIGKDNHIFQFSSIGEQPQDLKYDGESTNLKLGDRNIIREYVTLNRGTENGKGTTEIGSDNLFMAYCHVAHDCYIGDNAVFANAATLAGHVEVYDYAILGGFTAVHQYTRIGTHSFCGFSSAIDRDVLPYFTVVGNRAKAYGINKEGLKRRGFSVEVIKALQDTYKILVKSDGTHMDAIKKAAKLADQFSEVKGLLNFLKSSDRGWIR